MLVRIAVFLLGDRAVLRQGLPGRIARAVGLPMSLYRPHPYTLYELTPGWRSDDGRSRHNSLGFRGPDVAVPKPAGRRRVVCMGESTTYCTGIADDAATYPAQLQAYLARACPKLDIEVVNAGVGGYTSVENVLRCLFHVAPLEPDVIVYYYTHNDVYARRMPGLSRDYREYSRSWYEPWLGGGILSWIGHRWVLASGAIGRVVRREYERRWRRPKAEGIARNPPDAFRANITALVLTARAAGASVLLVNPPYPGLVGEKLGEAPGALVARAVWEHRGIIGEIGKKLSVPVYDLAADMPYCMDTDVFPNEYYFDGVHVNTKGAEVMALLIAKAIVTNGLLQTINRPAKLI